MAAVDIESAIKKGVELALNEPIMNGKSVMQWAEIGIHSQEQKIFVDSDGKMTPLPIQKHGHWIPVKLPTGVEAFGYKEYTVQEVICSECRFTEDVMALSYSYCPHCGTKMDEEVKQDG